MINLAQWAAKDLARQGVRVNAVCEGMVKTALTRSVWEAWHRQQAEGRRQGYEEWAAEKIRRVVPLGRWQDAEDVAAMAVFLASDRARNVTGPDGQRGRRLRHALVTSAAPGCPSAAVLKWLLLCGSRERSRGCIAGEVTERPKVRHWKCRVGLKPHRGFESRPLRLPVRAYAQSCRPHAGGWPSAAATCTAAVAGRSGVGSEPV